MFVEYKESPKQKVYSCGKTRISAYGFRSAIIWKRLLMKE